MPPANEHTQVALMILANVISVVGVIAANKTLYREPYNFTFASTLMTFHFICTWGFVLLARKLNWYTEKRIDALHYMKLGAAQAASVGFVNLSLMYNKVGMYQLFKFTNILVICAVEYLWKNKTYPAPIYACLFTLVAGVTLSTVADVNMSGLGLFHGIMGSVSTAFYQILNKQIQTECDVKPLQLLQFEQPYTAACSIVFAAFTDDVGGLVNYQFNTEVLLVLLLSGVFAFGVNVTCYLIIGKTSPVTYGVVGHTKTVLVFIYGFFFIKEAVTTKTVMGILIAFGSIIAYTHFTTNARPKKIEDPKAGEESTAMVAVRSTDPMGSDSETMDSTPPPSNASPVAQSPVTQSHSRSRSDMN